MNNEQTKEKMRKMHLNGILQSFTMLLENNQYDDLTIDEVIAFLIDAEWDDRYNRKLIRLIKNAKFKHNASIQEIIYDKTRELDKNIILRLSSSDYIKKGENIVFTGKTGSGKSYLACAFGNQACIHGYKVMYLNCLKLFSELKYAKADGTYLKEIEKIKKQQLIILDDFGLEVLDKVSRLHLLEIIEDRDESFSTIISSQLPTNKWHDVIGDKTIADAICDRLLHNAHKINVKGDSMRKFLRKDSGSKLPPKK